MIQKNDDKTKVKTRVFVFAALDRHRAAVFTQNGKSVTFEKGARFGSLRPTVKKETSSELSAAEEISVEAAKLISAGFKELNESEYKAHSQTLCFSYADDDLRRPCGENPKADCENKTLGQRAAELILLNSELKGCKTLELMLPPKDLTIAIETLAQNKSALKIETLILITAEQPAENTDVSFNCSQSCDENSHDAQFCSDDDLLDEDETVLTQAPCGCFPAAFPELKRLVLKNGLWRLEGGQCPSIEEIDAEQMLTPLIKLDNLKRLKYSRAESYSHMESEGFNPLSPADVLSERCPKLEHLDINANGDIEIFEDIVSSQLLNSLKSVKIGPFDGSAPQRLSLLLTRFTLPLSRLENLTLILKGGAFDKEATDRLNAFPLPLIWNTRKTSGRNLKF